MGILERIEKALQGWKTYIVAVLVLGGAVLEIKGIAIPGFIWPILSALGLGAVRSAIGKLKPEIPKDE